MKPRHCWMCVVLATCSVTQAQQVQPQLADFAMRLPLTVSGANGVVQLPLPLEVYRQSASPNLADLRVFNAVGEPMPFALLPQSKSERVRWREGTARLFPVYGSHMVVNAPQTHLDVRVAADGALVSVRTKESGSVARPLSALILDIGVAGRDELLDSVQLQRAEAATYRAELAIDRSDDLQLWDRVAQSRVDWLQGMQAESLVNDRVAIGARGGRYLRIQWLDGVPLLFERIIVRWRSSEATEVQPMEVKLPPAIGKVAGDLLYAAPLSIEVTQVGLELAMQNSVLSASIGYYQQLRRERTEVLVPIAQGTFYRLTQDGRERISSSIRIAPWANRQWVVRPTEPSDAKPLLVLRWYPSSLVFTARGGGASDAERRRFVLAVGAAPAQTQRWANPRTSVDRVAPGFEAAELAAAERAMGGEWQRSEAPVAAPSTPGAPWQPPRSLILWAVLILGAVVLGAMTWRLYRQMQATPPR